MLKKIDSFYLLKYCLLLVVSNVFSQTEIYRSDFMFDVFKSDKIIGSMIVSNNSILLDAPDDTLYSIDKKEGKINWKITSSKKFKTVPYLFDTTFFYGNNEEGLSRVSQFDLNTGKKIKNLPFLSLKAKPNFFNNIMYCTALEDGGKLMAYDLEEDKIIWQKNIGFGTEIQPVYLKDKIIANAEDDNWFEIDYNGNFLNTKSKKQIYLDTTQFFIKEYKFLTHDGKEITYDFLNKNRLSNSEYKIKTTPDNTFILSEKQLLILGNNKKKIVKLDLGTLVSIDSFYSGAYVEILEVSPENIWFYCQNHLVNYDFRNKNMLRKVDLTKWDAQQIALENRTIWLISNNNGQLYGLDFEPNQRTADEIEARAKQNRCTEPDPKKIEAAKAAQEKLKNKN